MKIAAISDIHGNAPALAAVMADIDRRRVDRIVNLGDIVSGPCQPRETLDLLMARDIATIRGNHERQLLTFSPDRMGLSDSYAAERITDEQRTWLEGLPQTLRVDGDVLIVHGSPTNDLCYLMETVLRNEFRPARPEEVAERLGDVSASLILCGHTHLQRIVVLPDGRTVANPGSVGLPAYDDDRPYPHKIENFSPHARYAVFERLADGWQADFFALPYDWEAAAAIADAHDRPDWGRAVRTGTV